MHSTEGRPVARRLLTRVVVDLLKRSFRIETPVELGYVQGVLLTLQLRVVQRARVPQLALANGGGNAHAALRPVWLCVRRQRRLWVVRVVRLMEQQLPLPVIYASASCAMAAGGQIEMRDGFVRVSPASGAQLRTAWIVCGLLVVVGVVLVVVLMLLLIVRILQAYAIHVVMLIAVAVLAAAQRREEKRRELKL